MTELFETIDVAGERAWQARTGSCVVRFGIGPPGGSGADARRARAVTAPEGWSVAWARQVHGDRVVVVEDDQPCPVAECDGLVTRRRHHAVLVWTADCVPVLLGSDAAVAAVHAGWRGTAAGVVARAVTMLARDCGVAPSALTAWLGPAVCGEHYPVGPEVVAALTATGADPAHWRHGDHVDLRGVLAEQLATVGVPRCAIHRVDACTVADPELASYRRDGAAAGRQWSLAVRL